MAKKFKILTLFLLIIVSIHGQTNYSSKVFHKHLQSCHVVGTTEEDFFIILNPDSTINILHYSSNYRDQYNSIKRQVYLGTYSKKGDTISVKFIDHSSTLKNKINEINTSYSSKKVDTLFNVDKFFQYPSIQYITNGNSIFSLDGLFPTLNKSTVSIQKLLDSKFNNWDKSLFCKKEKFGVSN